MARVAAGPWRSSPPTPRRPRASPPATKAKRLGYEPVRPSGKRALCPGLICVVADHSGYVTVHNRIVDAVGSVVPIHQVIDRRDDLPFTRG